MRVCVCLLVVFFIMGRTSSYGGARAYSQDIEGETVGPVYEEEKVSEPSAGNMLCGPISFKIVLGKHGKDIALDEAIKLTKTGGDATTMLGLKRAFEAKGLTAKGLEMSTNDLLEIDAPAILFVNGNHFFVVYGSKDSNFIVIDYPKDPYLMSAEELSKIWKGEVLLIFSRDSAASAAPNIRGDRNDGKGRGTNKKEED